MKTKLSPKAQNRLGCLAVVLIALLICFGLSIWWIYSEFISPFTAPRELPTQLAEARTLLGTDFLSKADFYKQKDDGYWKTIFEIIKIKDQRERDRFINRKSESAIYEFEDLKTGEFDGQAGLDVVTLRRSEALIFDRDGNLKKSISLEIPKKKVKHGWFEGEINANSLGVKQIVDIENDGKAEFFARGDWDGAALFNNDGKLVWRYGEDLYSERPFDSETDLYIEGSAVGDLNGDGLKEIVVGVENDGLHGFNSDGKEIWLQKKKEAYELIEIFDADGDGHNEVVELHNVWGEKGFLLTNKNGNFVKKVKTIDNLGQKFLMPSPDNTKQQLLNIVENKLSVMELDGKILLEAESPLSQFKLDKPRTINIPSIGSHTFDTESVSGLKGIWVKLKPNEPKFLAVLAKFTSFERALFYVFDDKGKLLYHEILPEQCQAIAALPPANSDGVEEILVGGLKTIWRYTAK
jgi:hypothetical protein